MPSSTKTAGGGALIKTQVCSESTAHAQRHCTDVNPVTQKLSILWSVAKAQGAQYCRGGSGHLGGIIEGEGSDSDYEELRGPFGRNKIHTGMFCVRFFS